MSDKLNIPNLDLYYVNIEYVKYLYDNDRKKNGFSQVPELTHYSEDQHKKFFTGVVLNVNGYKYFAPVSSKKHENKNVVLLKKGDKVLSSVRLCYMIPVPTKELKKLDVSAINDVSYSRYVKDEIKSINNQKHIITRLAAQVRFKGIKSKRKNSNQRIYCDFLYLEQLCQEWIKKEENITKNQDDVLKETALDSIDERDIKSWKVDSEILKVMMTNKDVINTIKNEDIFEGYGKALDVLGISEKKDKNNKDNDSK